MPGRHLALIPEVIRPDEVTGPRPVSDASLLDDLLADVRAAAARLEDPECGPAAAEVGRWLRVRIGETVAKLVTAASTPPLRCSCEDDDEDW